MGGRCDVLEHSIVAGFLRHACRVPELPELWTKQDLASQAFSRYMTSQECNKVGTSSVHQALSIVLVPSLDTRRVHWIMDDDAGVTFIDRALISHDATYYLIRKKNTTCQEERNASEQR